MYRNSQANTENKRSHRPILNTSRCRSGNALGWNMSLRLCGPTLDIHAHEGVNSRNSENDF